MKEKSSFRQFIDKLMWGDFLIIGIVIIASFSLWGKIFFADESNSKIAEIVADGKIILRYELDSGDRTYASDDLNSIIDQFVSTKNDEGNTVLTISNDGVHFHLFFKDGKVRFSDSDCPNQVCVKTGFISINGQVAACIPAGVFIRITGEQNIDDPDIILN